MNRKRAQLRYVARLRRTRLVETRFGPALVLAIVVLLVVALALCAVRFVLPAVPPRLPEQQAEETVAIPPAPVFAMEETQEEDAEGSAGTVALADVADVQYLADPSVYDGAILFAGGMAEETFDRLVRYDTVTGEAEGVLVPMQHDTLRNPVEDDARIVYVDAKLDGGGAIRTFDKETGRTSLICEIASDIPVLSYETPYLLWRERSGDGTVRIYVCHLGTGDEVTLAMAKTEIAACSAPSLSAGAAVYAEADPENGENGIVRTVHLIDGMKSEYAPGTYVQDPKRMGGLLLYTTGRHGTDNDLVCVPEDGAAATIAKGVIDYGIAGLCVAYGLDGAVWAYMPETGDTVRLSGDGYAQFAAAGEHVVVWREIGNAGHLVWKYKRMD